MPSSRSASGSNGFDIDMPVPYPTAATVLRSDRSNVG
jgi:hypothetical protein